MLQPPALPADRRADILDAAIPVFGRFGFRKTSVEELAAAAGLSKQGLYLHFSGKEALFQAAMRKYMEDGLTRVRQALAGPASAPLYPRLLAAMDAWFGQHIVTFAPDSFDVIDAGNRLQGAVVAEYKSAFQKALTEAIAGSAEFRRGRHACSAAETAQVLFICGLSWKEAGQSREAFQRAAALCIRACCNMAATAAIAE